VRLVPAPRALLALALAPGLLACGAAEDPADRAPPPAGALDAGAPGDPPFAEVEVGTGEDGFLPVADGEEVPLVLGPQGGGRLEGYHVTSAVRTRGLERRQARVTFRLLDEAGAEVGAQVRVFDLERRGEDAVAYGVRPRVADCCRVAGRPMSLEVEVEDQAGRTGRDARRVVAGPCLDDRGRGICP
jgi:hypothetical protein